MTSGEPEPAPAEAIPSIEVGPLPGEMAGDAERLLQEARDHLAASAFQEARDAARAVVLHYPGASGSGAALEILARASLALGETEEGAEAAEGFLNLLEAGHPAFPGAVLLQAEAFSADGQPEAALESLLRLPFDSPRDVLESASGLLEDLRDSAGMEALRGFAGALPDHHPLSETLGAELEGLRAEPVVLGAILPRSEASPGLMEYGEWVLEGIQVAIEEFQGDLLMPIELEVLDTQGEPQGAGVSVQRLEELGALGAVGPLTEELLASAAAERATDLTLISPFAFIPVEEGPRVLSLSGPDPGGADVVARYAWDLGLERVVVVRPGTPEAEVESTVFQDIFQGMGGVVPREVVYEPGATFFQAEFEQVGSLLPDGLFLPLTARDIQLLAPQFTYYGLDTLGIQLLGTSGWTEDEVVLEVDSRHTDGVVASTTRISQDETESFARFRERYEALFQKTLRSSVPAYGYDAAALLLLGLRENPRNGRELIRAMEGIEDFPGATGHLTVDEGRVIRIPQLIRIQNHELIYIRSHIH
jgi:ABC-type branched-subunit amino acid transport system substrate-binding protein